MSKSAPTEVQHRHYHNSLIVSSTNPFLLQQQLSKELYFGMVEDRTALQGSFQEPRREHFEEFLHWTRGRDQVQMLDYLRVGQQKVRSSFYERESL